MKTYAQTFKYVHGELIFNDVNVDLIKIYDQPFKYVCELADICFVERG